MARFRGSRGAFGGPGDKPFWTHGNKVGVGTACYSSSRVWFTLWRNILTEIYYPTVDRPQLRHLQFLFSDEEGLLLEEKRDFDYQVERLRPSQGYKISARDREGRFSYQKEIIAEPKRPCVLLHTKIEGGEEFLKKLKMYVSCIPHLEVSGENNNAFIVEVSGRELLVAEKENRWLAVDVSCGFSRLSCGYVGTSDGYTDLAKNGRLNFEFDEARNGNVALTGELAIPATRELTVGVALGESLSSAISCLFQSLSLTYNEQRKVFIEQWRVANEGRKSLERISGDGGHLFESSYNLLLTHQDKLYQGAFIASLSIPWGEAKNDKEGKGGYHLVWTRDLVQSALGLLAAGDTSSPFSTLVYLAAQQKEDGSFPQNFWVDGRAFWTGMQLDEVAFPVVLAWRLQQQKLLHDFSPRVMVTRAVNFLLRSGPVTGEERWERGSGYSPSTLAIIIAAFICTASLARAAGEDNTAAFLESYADFLRDHLEEWTVTTEGSLVPGCPRHFVRLNPAEPGEVASPGQVNTAEFKLSNQPPGSRECYPARDVVDAGFLQLVRYGILAADNPVVIESLSVVDAIIKAETPLGACWYRYNHDGYGQRPDGTAYEDWGKGQPWPLLVGERGHYELAVGRDAGSFLGTMERFSNDTCLLPEQIWNGPDLPENFLHCGGPTGSANPLMWAHSEYVRLLRSCHDGQVFDLIPEVAARYCGRKSESKFEFWLPKHPIGLACKDHTLRICAPEAFRLRWTADNWTTWKDNNSTATGIGSEYFDIAAPDLQSQVQFTFFWQDRQQWEGKNYQVQVR